MPPDAAARTIREQGGLVYIPHPFDPMRRNLAEPALDALIDAGLVDAIEVINAKTSLRSLNERAASPPQHTTWPPARAATPTCPMRSARPTSRCPTSTAPPTSSPSCAAVDRSATTGTSPAVVGAHPAEHHRSSRTTASCRSLHAIVLGLVQGLSEFLPISSSGHLLLVPWLFGWHDFDNSAIEKAFDVALHIGTLVAVVVYFRRDLVVYVREGSGWCPSRTTGDPRRPAGLAAAAVVDPRRDRRRAVREDHRRQVSASRV